MNWFEALILGILQGLTEFLPVSSSGHLEIGKALLGVQVEDNLTFDIIVHTATVCSTLVVFRKDIVGLFSGLAKISWNSETRYISKLIFSAIPVVFVGLFLEDKVEQLFSGSLVLVGYMLMVTALLLAFTHYSKPREKEISFFHAFIIGIAQAIAVLPGMSRSGATIATALLLKNKRENAARFSFLMVLLPILGKAGLDIIGGGMISDSVKLIPLFTGFISAFIVGLIACKLMISIVKRSKLIWFALYCFIVASLTLIFSL
ncbi:MAG: undecaprenyl-diphosphate phosphatase [Bacteroidales bacterium]|nr:undecaprenyl-diphosphate phosphatase [Bacteroidales bacterium]